MRKFLQHSDGRLRTERVSLLFFIFLVLGFSLIFNLQKPVDKAIVVVRHIFKASQKTPPPQAQMKVKVEPKDETRAHEPAKVKVQVKSEVKVELHKQAEAEMLQDKDNKVDLPTETVKKEVVAPQKQKHELEKKEASAVDTIKKSDKVTEKPAPASGKSTELESEETKLAQVESSLDSPSDEGSSEIVSEELVVDRQESYVAAGTGEKSKVKLMSESQQKFLSLNFASDKDKQKKREKKSVIKKVQLQTGIADKSDKVIQSVKNDKVRKVAKTKKSGKESITVAKKEYAKLHRAWQIAGAGNSDDHQTIPLQIENLRTAYNYLQMKAVVILPDNSCVDLGDGCRIPAESLERFSATVMQVKDPWQKWGPELKKAGLISGQSFKVRYYLYDFVRRSIYARVNQAYRWSLTAGLIKSQTKPDEVDVLGRTFVVKRSGGGAFGVFVPLSLKTRDGQQIHIDPLCFRDAPDVKALISAGII